MDIETDTDNVRIISPLTIERTTTTLSQPADNDIEKGTEIVIVTSTQSLIQRIPTTLSQLDGENMPLDIENNGIVTGDEQLFVDIEAETENVRIPTTTRSSFEETTEKVEILTTSQSFVSDEQVYVDIEADTEKVEVETENVRIPTTTKFSFEETTENEEIITTSQSSVSEETVFVDIEAETENVRIVTPLKPSTDDEQVFVDIEAETDNVMIITPAMSLTEETLTTLSQRAEDEQVIEAETENTKKISPLITSTQSSSERSQTSPTSNIDIEGVIENVSTNILSFTERPSTNKGVFTEESQGTSVVTVDPRKTTTFALTLPNLFGSFLITRSTSTSTTTTKRTASDFPFRPLPMMITRAPIVVKEGIHCRNWLGISMDTWLSVNI